MAHGEHTHEWKYNEVKETISLPSGEKTYTVIRFCLQCLEVEEVNLTTN